MVSRKADYTPYSYCSRLPQVRLCPINAVPNLLSPKEARIVPPEPALKAYNTD